MKVATSVVVQEKRYGARQKVSLLLGALMFLAIVLFPTPATFIESAAKKLDASVLRAAAEEGVVVEKDGKFEVADVAALLDWLKKEDPKAYKEVTKSANGMKYVLALAVLMAVWWIGEAIPLAATALLPLVVLPALGVSSIGDVAKNYASSVIFLFMGGFMIAAAMTKWNLHRRLALTIIDAIGTSPRKIVLGFMVAAAFISMWISNTATTMMMMPIALAIIMHIAEVGKSAKGFENVDFTAGNFRFGAALMLGIAYAASIGGVATIIGTPPNAIFVGTLPKLFPNAPEVTFVDWMMIGLPISVVMLVIAWLVLVYLLNPPEIDRLPGGREIIKSEKEKLGPWSRGEKIVLAVFIATALAWINSAPKNIGGVVIPGIRTWLPYVNDSVIAILAALALFLIPVDTKKGEFALDWKTAKNIPWGILLLFGGGIALSNAFTKSGLGQWVGEQLTFLHGYPTIVILLIVTAITILLTEMMSNTACATLMMPVIASLALAIGEDPRAFMASAAIAASFAFMLPVSTPPNAIVFSTGYVTVPQMVRNGIVLVTISIVVVTILCYILVPAVFGSAWGVLPQWVR